LGDLADRFTAFAEGRKTFFGAGLLAMTLRTDRVLRAADFFAELFFFLGLAIA
jgi:hypothetical protein